MLNFSDILEHQTAAGSWLPPGARMASVHGTDALRQRRWTPAADLTLCNTRRTLIYSCALCRFRPGGIVPVSAFCQSGNLSRACTAPDLAALSVLLSRLAFRSFFVSHRFAEVSTHAKNPAASEPLHKIARSKGGCYRQPLCVQFRAQSGQINGPVLPPGVKRGLPISPGWQ